jgi:hypothetical protein
MQTTKFKIIKASQAYIIQRNSVALDGNPEPEPHLVLFAKASVNGHFRRAYQLNIVVIKSSEVSQVFFSHMPF